MSETFELPPTRKRRRWPVVLGLVTVALLAAAGLGGFYVYQHAAPPAAVAAPVAPVAPAPVPVAPPAPPVAVPDDAKLAALSDQISAMQSLLSADHAMIVTLQSQASSLGGLPARVARLASVVRAGVALDEGQPLGVIPGAPPALAQFATVAPPTQAALLQAFPAAARAGEAASIAGVHQATIFARVMARLENLITITNGDHVILGAPAAGVMQQARDELNAGDLAGAVAKLSTLSESTQNAMAGWLQPARALLAARQALLSMAAQ